MIFKTLWRTKPIKTDKKSVIPANFDSFKYKTAIETRFADFDMMGHVNNAVYFTYMEVARTRYWKQAIAWDWEKTGIVIAKASVDFILPVYLQDKVTMYVRTSRVGNTSFDLEYTLVKHVNGSEQVCTTGKTVCVAFDYASKKSIPIPTTERAKMGAFEQL